MTQADVARTLEEHGLRLHATAIAKMEQRDASKPRAIRLSEAQAIATAFGLTVDEMMSDVAVEMEAIAKEFAQLESQAQSLRAQTGSLFERLRTQLPVLSVPPDEVPTGVLAARQRIIRALSELHQVEEQRLEKAEALLEEVWIEERRKSSEEVRKLDLEREAEGHEGLALARAYARASVWRRIAHRIYGLSMDDEVLPSIKYTGPAIATSVAARLLKPADLGASWVLVAVLSFGLWGHGINEELDLRCARKQDEHPDMTPDDARRESLREITSQIQSEWNLRSQEIMETIAEVDPLWSDAESLLAWVQAGSEV